MALAAVQCVPNIPSPGTPPGPNNPAEPCLPDSTGSTTNLPAGFDPSAAASWAEANYENVNDSSWRNDPKDTPNHCAEFVSSALHEGGGLKFTGNWRSNAALRPWELKNKRAYYNARSLKNWLESNGWVDSVSASQDELRSGVLQGAQPGDVVFYDWESSGGYNSVHTAIVVDVQNDVPVVVDQGAGQDHSRRQWNQSGLDPHVGVNYLDFEPRVEAVLMKWER
jgi:hypothetical protein